MKKRRRKKERHCFIIAASDADVAPLRDALARRGIHSSDALGVNPESPLSTTIESAIRSATFVCAVVPIGRNDAVMFEIGVAVGTGRPLLLFVQPGASPPTDIGIAYTSLALTNAEALDFHLGAFLDHLSTRQRRPSADTAPTSPRSRIDASRELEALRMLDTSTNPAAGLEDFVQGLFHDAGFLVEAGPSTGNRRVDLAVWLDELQPVIANPILVEVKYLGSAQQVGPRVVESFIGELDKAKAQVGLFVHHPSFAGESRVPQKRTLPLVISLSATELVRLLSEQRLAAEILTRRNRAVHGSD